MNKSNKFSPDVRERAVCMVQEHYPSLWAAAESNAPKIVSDWPRHLDDVHRLNFAL